MSSETDHPRQRTVAELLAAHGDAGTTGRRRRRREAADEDGGGAPGSVEAPGTATGPSGWPEQPPAPDRSVLREPVPQEPAPYEPGPYEPAPYEPAPYEPPREQRRPFVPEQQPTRYIAPQVQRPGPPPARPGLRPGPEPSRDRPTEALPRYPSEQTGVIDPGLTGPIDQQQLRPPPVRAPDDAAEDSGPSTMVGMAPPGAEAWHRGRVATRSEPRRAVDDDGGPPTQAAAPLDFDDHPAGLDVGVDADDERDDQPRSRPDRPAGQAWAAVIAQWIIGAIGGAALWVGFRFLWRELPVVALAAAVVVTVGLVVVVRALLRNGDARTTVFAVLVGLLLTVSPAILVLMGR